MQNIMPPAVVVGRLVCPGTNDTVGVKVLCDTGATGANYFPEKLFNKFREELEPVTTEISTHVVLGDTKTKLLIKNQVSITLLLESQGQDNAHHMVEVECHVIPGQDQLIIGLPTLLTTLYTYFIQLLDNARSKMLGTPEKGGTERYDIYNLVNVPNDGIMVEELQNVQRHIWTNASASYKGHKATDFPSACTPYVETQEEVMIPEPCSFPEALHYMEMTVDEARTEFLEDLTKHINPDFLKEVPEVFELLKTKGMQAMVPTNWEGLKNVELHIPFNDLLPTHRKPPARPINPKLLDAFNVELARLLKYHLRESKSPIASPLVIAPKATKPFIRFCGDYAWMKDFIDSSHYPLPHVQQSLQKIAKFKIFVDLDMANSYHQMKLDPESSAKLSLVTPKGQFEPIFLPEGVKPASGILQSNIEHIFQDFQDWTILIYDNFLILADSYRDAYDKLECFLEKCIEANLFLKPSKCWYGHTQVKFFGYIVTHLEYYLDEVRKQGIQDLPMPQSLTEMQRFLGSAIFFKPFIPHYSTLTSPLNEMTHKDFPWKEPDKWKADYLRAFKMLKTAVAHSLHLYYPDFELEWIVRTDASLCGVGGVLYQVTPDGILQPIAFVSWKFTDPATRWSTIEQECFGIFYTVRKLAYYLRCKNFTIETDHNNLIWMSISEVPKIVRMYAYLQSFQAAVKHIKGKDNHVADMLSRGFPSLNYMLQALSTPEQDMLVEVHNGRAGHHGINRTMRMLNQYYPGHGLSQHQVDEFIKTCVTCQKHNQAPKPSLPILKKSIPAHRGTVAIDTCSFPEDESGNVYVFVIINLLTKHVHLYPAPTKEGENAAIALFQYYILFGGFTHVHSDPGSEFTAAVFRNLTKYLGATRSVTLVDNPQADGVEPTVKAVKKHLTALCVDERCVLRWSDPTILSICQLIINEQVNSETGLSPLDFTFGNDEQLYTRLEVNPTVLDNLPEAETFMKALNGNLLHLREISRKHTEDVRRKRNSPEDQVHSRYQPGDYVLHIVKNKYDTEGLAPRHMGPYKVISHKQNSNTVDVQDLTSKIYLKLNASELMFFHGSDKEAFDAAVLDHNEFEVATILGYRGSPLLRSKMEVLVRFNNNKIQWCNQREVVNLELFGQYIEHSPYLGVLNLSADAAKRAKSLMQRSPIEDTSESESFLIDVRAFGAATYSKFTHLPDRYTTTYFVKVKTGTFVNDQRKTIAINVELFPQANFVADKWFLYLHKGPVKPPKDSVIITPVLKNRYKLKLTSPENE